MNTELRKRLEEAAEKCVSSDKMLSHEEGTGALIGFIAGAEHGYKEAIAQAKEWLEKHLEDDDNYYNEEDLCWIGREEFLADFEADMNKLWEGEK